MHNIKEKITKNLVVDTLIPVGGCLPSVKKYAFFLWNLSVDVDFYSLVGLVLKKVQPYVLSFCSPTKRQQ